MTKRNQDIAFGLEKEIEVLNIIKDYWKDEDNILNTKELYDEYCLYDFESNSKTSWELKTRKNKKFQYPTTILPYHKTRKVDTPQYFIFKFTDKCTYIKYTKEVFETFEVKDVCCYRDGRKEIKAHYHIPVNLLIDMDC